MSGSISRLARGEYERIDAINFSTLKHIAKSPRHYQHSLLSSGPDSAAKKGGRVVHIAAFEPELFNSSVAVWHGGRRAGAEWKAFQQANAGLELVKEDEHERYLLIQEAVQRDPIAAKYLVGAQAEMTAQWTHELPSIGGLPGVVLPCKGRIDAITPGAILDLKTARDGSPSGFGKSVWNYRYHVQAAFYVDGVFAATGRRLPYVMIVAENVEPFVVQVYVVPERILNIGREEYRLMLERLAFCRAENAWPGYAESELELDLPKWAAPDDDDEDVTGLGLELGEAHG